VDDGFRISSDPTDNQEDPALTSADSGKTRQEIRKSATKRNQDSDSENSAGPDVISDEEEPS
jgi:hypothetical protein